MISKTSRQLMIFHIFLYSKTIELAEITNIIHVSSKTIFRDIKDLKDAGLINIRFSKKENGYVHIDDSNHCPFLSSVFSDNKARNKHIKKLIRLATIMVHLRYHVESPYYDDNSKDQETCSSWYKRKFPNLSSRTMQRDFAELRRIGYLIEYNKDEKCYYVDFPEGIEGLENG